MKEKEIAHILIAVLLMGLIIAHKDFSINLLKLGYGLIFALIIISSSILGKELCAYKRGIDIHHNIWLFQRYSLAKGAHLRKPLPMGAILPLSLSIISFGFIKFFTFLQFDAEPRKYKVPISKGPRRYPEVNEWDMGVIAFWGLLFTLIIALLANYLGYNELARYAVYFSLVNLIPISQLDGLKLVFSSGKLENSFFIFPLFLLSFLLAVTVLIIIL